MKNFAGFTLFVVMGILASLWEQIDEQRNQSADLFKARQMLIECFAGLDLQRILEQNSEYLEELGAGYDSDNKRFFAERPIAGSQYRDAGFLMLISYPRPGEADICLYAPEHLSWQWLRSRVRRATSRINSPLVFEPMQQPEDMLPYSLPAPPTLQLQQCNTNLKQLNEILPETSFRCQMPLNKQQCQHYTEECRPAYQLEKQSE